jgi:hypothetical protein
MEQRERRKKSHATFEIPIDESKAKPTMEATPGNEMSNKPTVTFH